MDLKARLKHAPQGSLRLSKSHNHIQYYCCDEENKSGHYIPKDEFDLACKLAQKSYDKKALELAEKRLSQIRRITKDYTEDELEKLFLNEHVERQKLIKPIEKPWEQKVAEWKSNEYKGKEFQPGAPIILTEKGERLILTYETEATILNTGKIEEMVKRYL